MEKWRGNNDFTQVIITHTVTNFNLLYVAPY